VYWHCGVGSPRWVTSQGLVEAKQAIASVPVVMAASTHPLERGLITSYSRPGANITGEMFAKRVQLLAEALPRVSRIAIIRLPGDQSDLVVRDQAIMTAQGPFFLQHVRACS
jgi:ABC-type uncharacterized transport system substrate-binding protein